MAHFNSNQHPGIEVLIKHQIRPALLIVRVRAACDNEAIKFIHVQENQKMENNKMELNMEELEQVSGGWDLKSIWKKVRSLFEDDDESND